MSVLNTKRHRMADYSDNVIDQLVDEMKQYEFGDNDDGDLVMRKRDTKPRAPRVASAQEKEETPVNPDHEAVVADLINNPGKLMDMMEHSNMDKNVMRDAMRDITSNPEAMRGAREMMGVSTNEQLRDKMMQKMTKNGKQPRRKDVMRQQKDMKKVLRGGAAPPVALPPTMIHIDASKKLKHVSVIPKAQLVGGAQPDVKVIGHLRVFYNSLSKKQNGRVKRILGEALGEPVTLQHIDGITPLLPCEESLIQLAKTPYNPRLFDGTVDEDKLSDLIAEYCVDGVCKAHEEDGCGGCCEGGDIDIVAVKPVHDEKTVDSSLPGPHEHKAVSKPRCEHHHKAVSESRCEHHK